MYDLSFKFFLELASENDVIHPISLTKFRKLRLSDSDILEKFVNLSVRFALN